MTRAQRVAHRVGHGLLRTVVAGSGRRFANDSHALEAVQRRKLAELLNHVAQAKRDPVLPDVDPFWSWEAFSEALPPTDYPYWRQPIERQRSFMEGALVGSPVMRYQPTSGSTSEIKWLPYTDLFLKQLNGAIGPWLYDLYRTYPRMRRGSHYWSVSWLPDEMRTRANAHINDDMKLLSFGRRLLASLTQSVPESVSLAPRSDDAQFATLVYLLADSSLAVLSVWSPSFLLTLFERMTEWRDELVAVLQRGDWGRRQTNLQALPCPRSPRAADILKTWDGRMAPGLFATLWPGLALVSAWDTAASAPWAQSLQALLPHADFQGKGLWATEGVVTIPWQGKTPLAYQSHVYEFEDMDSGEILPPWSLQEGQEVQPLISTGAGLLRYRMNDRMRVSGHINSVPCFTFLGRNDGTDLVGEKIGAVFAQTVVDGLPLGGALKPVTLLAARHSSDAGQPGYILLLESGIGAVPSSLLDTIARALEAELSEQFHYRLARSLGQLCPARVVCRQDMREFYLDMCRQQGMIEGNIKIESLRHWPGTLPGVLRELATEKNSNSSEAGGACVV
ncbi:GH3 auxin-responsive promoter family protein [Alcanivorax sp. JB21]|uniref:GH3 family domain-containing protein n=1 Tax=Alcanivorax limicola TaxID=2874102 RepID=UPI001CBD984A|nr:GH3 auxin-responsive promoter family protein [Alcanivorax limicola]MBZ2188190.1 GH3 auxin-responsive promoter family protein [Alcanivorax limicola]